MISSLILLSASMVATPVFISDVKAAREAGHLRVEVRGDGGIDPEGARTVIDDGRLVIYLGGTRVRADNRSWDLQDGTGEIRAHRHRGETELVVPLAGNGCAGPVELTGSATGITALVGCDGPVVMPRVKSENVVARSQPKTKTSNDKLKELVELPAAAPAPAPAPPVPSAAVAVTPAPEEGREPTLVAVASGSRQAIAPPLVPAAPLLRVASSLTSAASPPPAHPLPVTTAPAAPVVHPPGSSGSAVDRSSTAAAFPTAAVSADRGTSGGGGSTLRAVALPALFLAALAAAAYLLARRRRGTTQRHIEILETTSLGPKRSLVFARIGDETVILASSEAGITLLKGTAPQGSHAEMLAAVTAATAPTAATVAAASTASATPAASTQPVSSTAFPWRADASAGGTSELDQPLQEALADIPEPGHEKAVPVRGAFRAIEGGLAGLFSRRGIDFQRDGADEGGEPRFDELLEDSVEDQELRRKLAAGMSARVR